MVGGWRRARDGASGSGSFRSMRWMRAVASWSWPARTRRVASDIRLALGKSNIRWSLLRVTAGARLHRSRIDIPGRSSLHPVGKGGLDRRGRVQRSEHDHRRNRRARKLGRDVRSNAGEAEHLELHRLAGGTDRLEVLAAVVPQAEVEPLPVGGLLDHVGVTLELVADRGPDEVGAVRIEAFLHHQIDMAEIDVAEIDRDLLAVAGPGPERKHIASTHIEPSIYLPITIHMDGTRWLVNGRGQ